MFRVQALACKHVNQRQAKACTLNFLSNQLHSVINEISHHRQRAEQNDRGVAADETDLHLPDERTGFDNEVADTVDDAVDEAEVETFPQTVSRKTCDRVDDVAVVKLVDAPFLFEDL